MPTKNPRINVTLDKDTYKKIYQIAAKKDISMGDQMRVWAYEGLAGTLAQENIDIISTVIRSELNSIINPKVERLAALGAKTCVQASTAAYLNAETINRLLPESLQDDFEDVYTAARKKAVKYTKNKVEREDDI